MLDILVFLFIKVSWFKIFKYGIKWEVWKIKLILFSFKCVLLVCCLNKDFFLYIILFDVWDNKLFKIVNKVVFFEFEVLFKMMNFLFFILKLIFFNIFVFEFFLLNVLFIFLIIRFIIGYF